MQSTWRMLWISKPTSAQEHACARASTHPHTHTHTDQYVILTAFPQQQWFRKRASLLRYTYIVCLVFRYIVKVTQTLSNERL